MLSACAPCIGHWTNPIACSGQDQDPSDETIRPELLAFENCHTRWPAKWAIKSKEAAGRQLKFVRSEDALAKAQTEQ